MSEPRAAFDLVARAAAKAAASKAAVAAAVATDVAKAMIGAAVDARPRTVAVVWEPHQRCIKIGHISSKHSHAAGAPALQDGPKSTIDMDASCLSLNVGTIDGPDRTHSTTPDSVMSTSACLDARLRLRLRHEQLAKGSKRPDSDSPKLAPIASSWYAPPTARS